MSRTGIYAIFTVVLALFNHTISFSYRISRMTNARVRMSSVTRQSVVVIGVAGGVAETITADLSSRSVPVIAILDRPPCSPLLKSASCTVLSGDIENSLVDMASGRDVRNSFAEYLSGKIIVAVDDAGDEGLRRIPGVKEDERTNVAEQLLTRAFKRLPPTVTAIVSIASMEAAASRGGFGSVFGQSGYEQAKTWCQKNDRPFSAMKYGKLIGGVPGAEPVSFVGLPQVEPELHPSFRLRSVLFTTPNNKYAATELCTRKSMGGSVARLVGQPNVNTGDVDALVISIAGDDPTDKDWERLFGRLSASGDVEVLRVDFKQIAKPQQLLRWVVDAWFPAALIDADVATVSAGARPVRAELTADNVVRIFWEELQPDLSVKRVGSVEIRISQPENTSASLAVVRLASRELPGEMQLMDKLVEGLKTVALKKQFVVMG